MVLYKLLGDNKIHKQLQCFNFLQVNYTQIKYFGNCSCND